MHEHLRRAGFNPRAATVEDDDGAVELSLGLSIGGAPWKAGRVAGGDPRRRGRDVGSGDAGEDLGGSVASVSSSSTPPPPPPPFGQRGLDPRTRREMHARRRQEARMKRQEKQQKRGICRAGRDGAAPGASAAQAAGFHGAAPPPDTAGSVDDQVPMEAQAQRVRARDREVREEERRDSNWITGEHQEPVSDIVPKPELCLVADPNPSSDANPNPGSSLNFCNPNLPTFGAHPFPALALQYPYPHVQYLPIANGFGFPYMMPCWASGKSPAAGAPGAAANVFEQVACRAFQPFSPLLVDPTTGVSPLGRKVVDSGTGKNTGAKRALSRTGSLGSNGWSAISDHQSNSLKGGSSGGCSDIRSHPSNVPPVENPQPQPSPEASNLGRGQSEHSISSRQIIAPGAVQSIEAPRGHRPPSASTQRGAPQGDNSSRPPPSTPVKTEGSPSVDKPVSAADRSAPSPQTSPPLPQMPCVSTTGDGPNGKTITGFLYRYTSTEVCIVCVCHGSSFSPAEFVRHAGGTDTGNPLRHIVVVPS